MSISLGIHTVENSLMSSLDIFFASILLWYNFWIARSIVTYYQYIHVVYCLASFKGPNRYPMLFWKMVLLIGKTTLEPSSWLYA